MMHRVNDFNLCPVCLEEKHFIPYSNGKKVCTKCKNELLALKLEPVDPEDEIPDNCPFCGEENEIANAIYDKFSVIIFKCKKCRKPYGYKYVVEDYDWSENEEPSDDQYSRKAVRFAEKEGKPLISASAARKIIRENSPKKKNPKQKCQDKLTNLIKEKRKALGEAGVDKKVLENAIARAQDSINENGTYTDKQLKILLPATILAEQERLIANGKTIENAATERLMNRVFGTDRKTIRKWKKKIQEQH